MSAKELYRAVKAGNVEAVAALISADPELVNARDAEESTPLHWAAWKGHAQVIEALLDAGADIQAHNKTTIGGRPRCTLPPTGISARRPRC